MPFFMTKYGRKEFSYTTLKEYKKALLDRMQEVLPAVEHDFFGEVITEIDVNEIKNGDCAFGGEFQTLQYLSLMLDNYEDSDSPHSVVDFYNQNHAQYMVLGGRARETLVRCHALQNKFKSYQEANVNNLELLNLLTQMKRLLENATRLNNTSIAANLSNEILLEGRKKLENLHGFNDFFTNDLNDTVDEVNKLLEEF